MHSDARLDGAAPKLTHPRRGMDIQAQVSGQKARASVFGAQQDCLAPGYTAFCYNYSGSLLTSK